MTARDLTEPERISCIMVTGKTADRLPFARRSVDSFLDQTYPDTELVVVNDGAFALADFYGDRIREVRPATRLDLGTLRNIALDLLPPDSIWVQWDDDDWHHPDLISRQYQRLVRHSADAVVLQNQIQYSILSNTARVERRSGLDGTIMCRNKDIRYPAVSRGEDTVYLTEFSARHDIVAWQNAPWYYIRMIHGGNTWEPSHFAVTSCADGQWALEPEEVRYLNDVLQRYAVEDGPSCTRHPHD